MCERQGNGGRARREGGSLRKESERNSFVCGNLGANIFADDWSCVREIEHFCRPVREGRYVLDDCTGSVSLPLGIESPWGDLSRGDRFECGSGKALIEGTTVRPAMAPAICGCLPRGRCTSFDNLCFVAAQRPSVRSRLHDSDREAKGERQSFSISLALQRMHTYTHVHSLCGAPRTCIAMLPRTRMYRVMNPDLYRIRGSSPL